jgi:hypothetical protein
VGRRLGNPAEEPEVAGSKPARGSIKNLFFKLVLGLFSAVNRILLRLGFCIISDFALTFKSVNFNHLTDEVWPGNGIPAWIGF